MSQQLILNPEGLREMLNGLREQRQSAKERHDQLLAQVSELQQTITALDQAIAPLARLLDGDGAKHELAGSRMAPVHADSIEMIMSQQDRRWRIAELIERLGVIGHPLPTETLQQYSTIHSSLKRRPKKFRRVARGLWVLVGSEADRTARREEERESCSEITVRRFE